MILVSNLSVVLVLYYIVSPVSCSAEKNPGFRTAITNKGLDYGEYGK